MIKKAADHLHTFALGEYILLIDESNFSLANFLADGCLSTAAAAAVAGIVISGAKMGAYVLRTLSPSIGAFVAFIPCLSMRESMSVLGIPASIPAYSYTDYSELYTESMRGKY